MRSLLKNSLKTRSFFYVKDLGFATKFLGIKIEHETARGSTMSQQLMILNLIDQFGLKHTKPVVNPVAEVVHSAEDLDPLPSKEAAKFRTL